jgi:hypothetical protein
MLSVTLFSLKIDENIWEKLSANQSVSYGYPLVWMHLSILLFLLSRLAVKTNFQNKKKVDPFKLKYVHPVKKREEQPLCVVQ